MRVWAAMTTLLAMGLVLCSSRSRVADADPIATTATVTPPAGEGVPSAALPSPILAPLPLCPAPGKGAASYT